MATIYWRDEETAQADWFGKHRKQEIQHVQYGVCVAGPKWFFAAWRLMDAASDYSPSAGQRC
jgi:hypothetical protein